MAVPMPPRHGWHFINVDNTGRPILLYGDARNAELNVPLSVDYPEFIGIGIWGLHYGNTLYDAFNARNEVWQGFKICKVKVSGHREADGEIGTAETRCILEMKDGYPIFKRLADFMVARRDLHWSYFETAAQCSPERSFYMLRNIEDGMRLNNVYGIDDFNRLLTRYYREAE